MQPLSDCCRCPWVDVSKPDYVAYHDTEWGVPVHNDRQLFEFLVLESAQAGLSWYTVLRKRDHYRQAFADFDVETVAGFGEAQVAELLQNPGIIRNRLKVNAAINNASRFLEVVTEYGSFDRYLWQFVDGQPIVSELYSQADFVSTSPESDALSDDLKRRGFQFVGSTICYAYMQAVGMVNDHVLGCCRRQAIIEAYTSQMRSRVAQSPLARYSNH